MELQAGSSASTSSAGSPHPKTSLDIPSFGEKSLLLPIPLGQWKNAFSFALHDKTNIDVRVGRLHVFYRKNQTNSFLSNRTCFLCFLSFLISKNSVKTFD